MAIKLVLRNTSESSETEEYTFDQQRITIGRDMGNDLHIPDSSRVVSKKHAEIHCTDEGYDVEDLGSKNFTYLNSGRLESGRTYSLQDGDMIKLGEYEVEFVVLTPEPEPEGEPEFADVPDFDKTVFDSSFVNPFEEEVGNLMASLQRLSAIYDDEAPNRRADALKDALFLVDTTEIHESWKLVLHKLNGNKDVIDADATDPVLHDSSKAAQNGEVSSEPVPPQLSLTPLTVQSNKEPSPRQDHVMDVLFNVLAMLVSIPWEFRHEFVGHTIAQTPESAILYEGNADKLKNFLLDASLSESELARRLMLIEEGGDEVILHQLAMLDGYKAVVQQGMHMLLREIDPIVAAENLAQSSALYKAVPRLSRLVASWGLQEKFQELRGEDWSITERRAYRPSFIRAYLSRMSSGPQKVANPG